jgi:hypothetical protein
LSYGKRVGIWHCWRRHRGLPREVTAPYHASSEMVSMAPVADLTEQGLPGQRRPAARRESSAAIVQAASPIAYVNGDYPPTLLIHGLDTRVPHAMTMHVPGVGGGPTCICAPDRTTDQEAKSMPSDAMVFSSLDMPATARDNHIASIRRCNMALQSRCLRPHRTGSRHGP